MGIKTKNLPKTTRFGLWSFHRCFIRRPPFEDDHFWVVLRVVKVGEKFWWVCVCVMFRQLFLIKIHAKCFQITHKTTTFPILKITKIKYHTWSVFPYKNWMVKNNYFDRAVQSNNAVCDGFHHVIYCCFWDGGF